MLRAKEKSERALLVSHILKKLHPIDATFELKRVTTDSASALYTRTGVYEVFLHTPTYQLTG